MLHIVTVHYGTAKWVEIQSRYLRRHISAQYVTWTSLDGIAADYGKYFDNVIPQSGMHAPKLNHLALEVVHRADDQDLLMFLDSDAFPIADPMPLIERGLRDASLIAIRRVENADEPQPHPSFCVTSVSTWRRLGGDWTGAYTWPGPLGGRITDVGGNLLRSLELSQTPWTQVLRSNGTDLDPLYFGVYGDTIYHHGAGSRPGGSKYGNLSPAHWALAPSPATAAVGSLTRPLGRLINGSRWRRWERQTARRIAQTSDLLFDQMRTDDEGWLPRVGVPAHGYSTESTRG